MNIDEQIKKELGEQAKAMDSIIIEQSGLLLMLKQSFTGGMRFWMVFAHVITLVLTVVMFWSGYRFFIAESMQQQLFWGVCCLAAIQAQIALKQWIFAEVNRSSLMREIKRVEVCLQRLTERLGQSR